MKISFSRVILLAGLCTIGAVALSVGVLAEDGQLDEVVLQAEFKARPHQDSALAASAKRKEIVPTSSVLEAKRKGVPTPANESKHVVAAPITDAELKLAKTAPTQLEKSETTLIKDPRTGVVWSKDRTYGTGAVLRTLNKITARSSEYKIPLHQVLKFGNLDITVRSCWHAPADELPDNKALIEIWDNEPGKDPVRIFFGWMFSSTPSISGLEHPVYDVVVKECY
ncbi:MAG: DUF2155 domain-containing protein [Alphaproteobacteria bacterium]|nr:DUF2155 domain-containing protein [Alphaproteobacteria bacterium]